MAENDVDFTDIVTNIFCKKCKRYFAERKDRFLSGLGCPKCRGVEYYQFKIEGDKHYNMMDEELAHEIGVRCPYCEAGKM